MKPLFENELNVVNVGLRGFADNIAAAGGKATHLSWAPPAGADAGLGWTLACVIGDPRIREANRIAHERYLAAQPRLVDLVLQERLDLEAMVTDRISLDQLDDGFAAMHRGSGARTVVVFDELPVRDARAQADR